MAARRRRLPWVLALGLCGLAGAAAGQAPAEPGVFGERIDVRTGFVRVTLPGGVPPPRLEEIEVLWRKQQPSFEPMRAAALELVDRVLSDDDRVFAVAFTDAPRFLAEGRGEAAKVIASLPTEPETGNHPTALFESLTRTLQLFENADARAALLVVSDGCDTARGPASADSVARQARDAAIAVFLVMPSRRECVNTICQANAAGAWACKPDTAPKMSTHVQEDPSKWAGAAEALSETLNSATAGRDRFASLISRNGGGDYVARDPDDWQRALKKMFERLGRQWTVVFEPTSAEVRSDEIKVYSNASGRRKRLE